MGIDHLSIIFIFLRVVNVVMTKPLDIKATSIKQTNSRSKNTRMPKTELLAILTKNKNAYPVQKKSSEIGRAHV